MRYRIRTGPDEHPVTLSKEGAGYRAEVAGQSLEVVELDHVAGPRVLLVDHRVVVVEVGDRPRVAGRFLDAAVESEAASAGAGRSHKLHGGTLKSPMPGRVLRVCVAVGDLVTTDTEVLVVEAMKMENQLFAPCAGRIEQIAVSVGDSVEAQAELLRVAAPPEP